VRSGAGKQIEARGVEDPLVLEAMRAVPRHLFVPEDLRKYAYDDHPLPIGYGQTISQPYIVALMTQLLRLTGDCRVFEIGTGSGYQTAVLARLVKHVYTIEKHQELSTSAQNVLATLAVANVEFRVGDGSCGWPDGGTFDRVMITAAVPGFPQPVVAQLAEAGLIVAPVGAGSVQQLIVAEKRHGRLIERYVCGCRFVRLIGAHGFQE